jgi:membrane peptidoglycan carboxypeptidase
MVPIAGKTGTTSDYSDAWFVAILRKCYGCMVGKQEGGHIPGKERSGSSIALRSGPNIHRELSAGAEGGTFRSRTGG